MSSNAIKDAVRQLVLPIWYLRHRMVPRESYAADREDTAAALLLGSVGRFIDVGANDGFSGSNCLRFALRGARGLYFEPDPGNYARLAGLLRLNRGVRCIREGLSDAERTVSMRCDGVLSTITSTDDQALADLLDAFRRKNAPEVEVRVSRLSCWLQRWPEFSSSDLLSIDVEGHELNVIKGIDWERTPKPARCIIVETHAVGRQKSWTHRDLPEIASTLSDRRYLPICKSGNNTFWLHVDDVDRERILSARRTLPGYVWMLD